MKYTAGLDEHCADCGELECVCKSYEQLKKENEELKQEVECEEIRFRGLTDQLCEVVKEREELRAQLDAHKAARIAYALEFPLDDNDEPDIGSIHHNIRDLRAQLVTESKISDDLVLEVEALAGKLQTSKDALDNAETDTFFHEKEKETYERINEERAVKITELEAQLARCRNDLTLIVKRWRDGEWKTVGDCLLDVEAVIACLPKTASLDAEVLRCATGLINNTLTGLSHNEFMSYKNLYTKLEIAVRARDEVK